MKSFGGIITQLVTETNDPRYYIGQVFSGYYQYESTSGIDGTFHIANSLSNTGTRTLKGLVYLPFPRRKARLNALPETMNDGYLTVASKDIADFKWSIEQGGFFADFGKTAFLARLYGRIDPSNGNELPDIETKGTVSFTPPERQS